MKSYLFFMVFLCFIVISCDNSNSSSENPTDTPMEDLVNVKDTISEKKFNKWKKQWEKDGEAFMDTASQFKYFTLPVIDLTEVLAENAVGTKYYFGLEKITQDKYYLKFMLVGTDKKESDLIDYANQNYIYDMSKTCPPFCDPG